MFWLINRPSAKIRSALLLPGALLIAGCGSPTERAQSYYEHGVKLVAGHDNAKAAIEFRNAIKLNKKLLPAWRGLAQIEEANQHWEGLAPVLRGIVDLDPKDTESRIKLARILILAGAADEALKVVNGADEADNGNAALHALKAAISYKLKDIDGAVREAQAALKIDPNNAGAMIVLAADRLARGDAKDALKILDSDAVSHEKDLGVQLFKIKIFEQLNDLPQLESLLRRLVDLYPQEVAFRKQLIGFYVNQHRPADAEKEVRAMAAADPKNSDAGLDVARFLYAIKGPAEARQELVARIKAGGEVFPYQLALADLDFAQGKTADSLQLLETLAKDSNSPDHALAAKVELAQMNFNIKNMDAAEALVSDILSKDGRNIGALKLRASIRLDRGQLDPAIADLRVALNDQPRSPELMLLLASAYERGGSIELAEKQFADALRASNFSAGVGLSYVAFLRRRGNIQRAEDVLTQMDGRQPNNLQILSALAEVMLTRQDWAGAQEISEKMRRISDGRGIADQVLGAALIGRNKYDESIAVFQDAVAAAPSAMQPVAALVRALVRAKKTDRAVALLQSMLQTNPANAEAHVLLGSIRLANNEADQAKKSFLTAIEKQPKDPNGYRALVDLYLRQNNADEALKTVQAGLMQQPDSIILQISLAGVLEQKGDYEGSISEYEHILTEQPDSLIVINNLASMLADHRTDKASLDRAQSLAAGLRKAQVPQFKDTLGWVDYREGDLKTAVPLLGEAAVELPDSAMVHYHLGMGYSAIGQAAKALDEFKTALARAPSSDLEEKLKSEIKKVTAE